MILTDIWIEFVEELGIICTCKGDHSEIKVIYVPSSTPTIYVNLR